MAHRILLLGPDPSQLRALHGALARAGQQAIYAESLNQGAVLARQFNPSLIALVTDLNGQQGREDLAGLMMRPATASLPVFVLTRGISPRVAVGALRTGATDLIVMPTKLEVFLARVTSSIGDVPGHPLAKAAVDRKGPALLKRVGNYLRRMAADAEVRIDGASEPGTLRFANGRIVEAHFGGLEGSTAIQRLLTEPAVGPWAITLLDEAEDHKAPSSTPAAMTPEEATEPPRMQTPGTAMKAPSLPPQPPEEIDIDDDDTVAIDDEEVLISVDLDSLDDVGVELFDEEIAIDESGVPELPAPTPEALAALAPARILLVDDDPALLNLYEKFLAKRGFEVITAENGKLGYEKAIRERPDVIVSDIMMPETDGWGFLTLVRRDARLADTRFLLLSCHGEYLEKLKELQAGANDYLEKGLRGDAVVERVSQVIASQRHMLAALRPGVSFSGMVQAVGLRTVLQAFGSRKVSGTFVIEDRFARHQVQFSDGQLIEAKSEAGLTSRTGDDAMAVLLGVDSGYFEFTASSPTSEAGEDITAVLDRVGERLNQQRQHDEEQMFAQNAKLECDPKLADFYLVVCPDLTRPLARSLVDGTPPRELLVTAGASPVLVEWVVQDMLRKHIGTFAKAA